MGATTPDEKSGNDHIEAVGELSHHPVGQTSADRADAIEAEDSEHQMTTREAFRFYWKAVLWSMLASTVLVMEGFDGIGGNFQVLQPWLQRYGVWSAEKGMYIIEAKWQMGLSEATSVGCLFGVLIGAWQVDRFGYRWSMIANMTVLSGFLGLQIFAPNVEVLLVANMLTGFVYGAMMCLTTAFASELCPIQLRGYLTSYCNMCWVMGGMLASIVINAYTNYHQDTRTGYIVTWSLQWIWPAPIAVGMFFCPESPWWLVRKGRLDDAEASLRRLQSHDNHGLARKTVMMIVRTNELEKELSGGATFLDCFKGTDFRRTEIACCAYACQMTCGVVLSWTTVYWFVQAGLSNSDSFRLGLGQSAIALAGTLVAWLLIRHIGRRTIYLWGMGGMAALMIAIGVCGCYRDDGKNKVTLWVQAALMLTWVLTYDLSVGPVAFTIIGEVSSSRLRNKTISLARFTYNFISLISGLMNPYMINSTAWNWGAKAGFYWAGWSVLSFVWIYFRLPETGKRSYRELDILFERRIPARQFKSTVVEQDADDEILQAKQMK